MTLAETAPDTARFVAAAGLQRLLPELVALTMHAKQVHWNLIGPGFLPLHALTDAIADDTRTWADRVAERALALDFAVDARPETVAAAAGPFSAGRVRDQDAVVELMERAQAVAITARKALDELEDADPVAHDAVVEVLEGVEKYRWMLRAQQ